MAEAGLREQEWPYLKDDLRPPFLPLCRDKSSPETWGGADEKVQSLLSVPLTLVPEAVVPNNYWKSEPPTALRGEGKRKKRRMRVSDGSPESSSLPWTTQMPLHGQGYPGQRMFLWNLLTIDSPGRTSCLVVFKLSSSQSSLVARLNANPANTPGL